MYGGAVLLLTVIGFATTTTCSAASPVNTTLQLPAFHSIRSCLPFPMLVLPQDATVDNNSTAVITADADVINAIGLTVDGSGVLVLNLLHGFTTSNAIRVTIIPSNSSSVNSFAIAGVGDLILGPGFNVSSLNVIASGTGTLLGYGLSADVVAVTSSG